MKHLNVENCPRCAMILKDAHPVLRAFAATFRRDNHDAHVAWTYRGERDQNAAFATGKSHARFGESPHNYSPSLALDWFRLLHTGADWGAPWFRDVLAPAVHAAGLVWGGDFKSIHDLPHVELPDWRSLIPYKV